MCWFLYCCHFSVITKNSAGQGMLRLLPGPPRLLIWVLISGVPVMAVQNQFMVNLLTKRIIEWKQRNDDSLICVSLCQLINPNSEKTSTESGVSQWSDYMGESRSCLFALINYALSFFSVGQCHMVYSYLQPEDCLMIMLILEQFV